MPLTPKARPVHRAFAALLALLTTTGPGALAPGLALGGGIALASASAASGPAGAGGQASALWVTVFTDASQDASQLYLVSLTASPPTAKLVLTATGAGSHLMSLTPGPHGCLYVTSTSTVLRVSAAGQACT